MILIVLIVTLVFQFTISPVFGVRWQAEKPQKERDAGIYLPTDDELRIFAATFNTGNADSKDYTHKQRAELVRDLTDSHESAGGEADMIFMGFQEFRDYGASFGNDAKTHLWKSLSAKKIKEVEQMINDVVTIPQHVHAAKADLFEHFRAFHNKLSNHVKAFSDEFGEYSEQFHRHLGDNSKLTMWGTQNMTSEMSAMLRKRQTEQLRYDEQVPDEQYRNFTLAVEALKEITKTHPDPSFIRYAMKPIHQWTDSALRGVNQILVKYPNIKYTDMGIKALRMLFANVNRAKSFEKDIVENNERKIELQSVMDEWLTGVKKAVTREEKTISTRLYHDLAAASDAMATLNNDIMKLVQNGNKDDVIAASAKQVTRPKEHSLDNSVMNWDSSTIETFEKLLRQASFQMDGRHFDVNLDIQKFRSGFTCHTVNHFDTFLYVYVNPWSEWNISSVQYSSDTCKMSASTTSNTGCSIDNNQKNECGKSVNLQVFKAQKRNKSINVCALNTHMSYAGEAIQRMQYIKQAVEEAKNAGCDTLVFVGDFNSRLHCDTTSSTIAPYDRLDPSTNSSFKYLIDTVCTGGKCSLKHLDDKILYYDELMQMMDMDRIKCLEKREERVNFFRSKAIWSEVGATNILKNLDIFEAGVPDFEPTYKVASLSKASKFQKEWYFCQGSKPAGREQTCLVNKVQKGKHNPSWTDRILLWPSKGGKAIPKATSYVRPLIDPSLGSDHMPVASQVTITVP